MSNFIEEFKKGQQGLNQGLFLGEGLEKLNKELNGVQKGMQYIIAAPSKVGKSTLVNYGFVINPYLDALKKGKEIEFTYFSYEMSRILQEYDFACYFLNRDYGITHVTLEGETYKGKTEIELSSKYLRGQITNDDGETILVKPAIKEVLVKVYENWIVPLFGEYSTTGLRIKKGVIDFIEHKENPTGLYYYLLKKAKENGTMQTISYQYKNPTTLAMETREKIVSYLPNNPDRYDIIVTDTVRKLPRERGFSMKENIDKWLEMSTELRNLLDYSFVNIIHTNRSLGDLDTIKHRKDNLYPTSDNVKDSSNASEECSYLITMFNPNDDRYNLPTHFGRKIRDVKGNPLFPNLRTIHIVESRHSECPLHFAVEMEGNIKNFKQIAL